MPRPSKVLAALARARQAPPFDPLDEMRVVRLTERFLELKRETFRALVDKAVELGEILIEGKPLLPGNYTRWLQRLGLDNSTADNYVALAELSDENPRILQKYKELGPTKLYAIAQIPEDRRERVLRTEGLDRMRTTEFKELVEPLRVRARVVTGNMRAVGLRNRVRAFVAKIERLKLGKIEDEELRGGLRADLERLCRLVCGLAKQV